MEGAKEVDSEMEVIMLTGQATIDSAVESMKRGAYDYLTKPCRLNIVQIYLPPLRDRKDDIPLLVQHFLKNSRINTVDKKFSPDALESVSKYNWPGNIRELENLVENMLIVMS